MATKAYLIAQHRVYDPLSDQYVPINGHIGGAVVHDDKKNNTGESFHDHHFQNEIQPYIQELKSSDANNPFPDFTNNAQCGHTWHRLNGEGIASANPLDEAYDPQSLSQMLLDRYYGLPLADMSVGLGTKAVGGAVAEAEGAEHAAEAPSSSAAKASDSAQSVPSGGEWRVIHGRHVFIEPKGTIAEGPSQWQGRTPDDVQQEMDRPNAHAAFVPSAQKNDDGTYSINLNGKKHIIGGGTEDDKNFLNTVRGFGGSTLKNILGEREKLARGIKPPDYRDPISDSEIADMKETGYTPDTGNTGDTRVARDSKGSNYFVKYPGEDESASAPHREDFVYDLANHFGLNVPAHRTMTTPDGKTALVTRAVENATTSDNSPLYYYGLTGKSGNDDIDNEDWAKQRNNLTKDQEDELTKQALFDQMFCNGDNHSGNTLYTPQDGKFVSIDRSAPGSDILAKGYEPNLDTVGAPGYEDEPDGGFNYDEKGDWKTNGGYNAYREPQGLGNFGVDENMTGESYLRRVLEGSASISRKTAKNFFDKTKGLDARFKDRTQELGDIIKQSGDLSPRDPGYRGEDIFESRVPSLRKSLSSIIKASPKDSVRA